MSRTASTIALLAGCGALVTAVAFGYAEVLGFSFVGYDDGLYIGYNDMVRRGWTWDGVVWAFTNTSVANWHPITWLSHMLDVEVFGLDPSGHHATSVVLHAANACLFFLVLSRATGSVACSGFAALLFAVHPLRVESVAWIAERKDVLSMFFALLSLGAYVRFARTGSRGAYAGALGLYALGLMSKATLVMLPVGLLVLDGWPLGRLDAATLRKRVVEKLPFFALAAVIALVTLGAHGGSELVHRPPLALQIANVVRAYGHSLAHFFWPSDLAVLYPYPRSLAVAPTVASMIALLAVTTVAIRQMRARPWLLAGWLWFLAWLLPVSGIVVVGYQGWADRYMHLPSLGLSWVVVWAAREGLGRLPAPRAVAAVLALAVAVGGVLLTRTQARYWRNQEVLFERAVTVTEGNFVAHAALGREHLRQGRHASALRHQTEALRIFPQFARALAHRGLVLLEMGRPLDAQIDLKRALAIDPDAPGARRTLERAREVSGSAQP